MISKKDDTDRFIDSDFKVVTLEQARLAQKRVQKEQKEAASKFDAVEDDKGK